MPKRASIVRRLWLAIPDRCYSVAGFLFFLWYLVMGLPDYRHFWTIGPYYRFADGSIFYMPWTRVLSDWTGLLVVLGFLFRRPPIARNTRMTDVALGLLGSYWLFIPFVISAGCTFVDRWQGTHLAPAFRSFWSADSLSLWRTFLGVGLVTLGNSIDMWGYSVLLRSFSLVPEARELRITGPYRIMRHPVYFGQMLAQAGIYLCFAPPHLVWFLFWVAFCGIQLARAWREEQVLAAAFGARYLNWKRRTFWVWGRRSEPPIAEDSIFAG